MGASRFQGKVVVSSHNELSTMSDRSRTILGMDFLVGRQWREWVWAAAKNTPLYFVQFLSRELDFGVEPEQNSINRMEEMAPFFCVSCGCKGQTSEQCMPLELRRLEILPSGGRDHHHTLVPRVVVPFAAKFVFMSHR